MDIEALAATLVLGELLNEVRASAGEIELVDHFSQGEFHHDVVLRTTAGEILVVATNCNGGVKEVLLFDEVPAREALWAMRCPGNPEFPGDPAKPRARTTTLHWFDPCELLAADARSELLPEHRERQPGGGWRQRGCGVK